MKELGRQSNRCSCLVHLSVCVLAVVSQYAFGRSCQRTSIPVFFVSFVFYLPPNLRITFAVLHPIFAPVCWSWIQCHPHNSKTVRQAIFSELYKILNSVVVFLLSRWTKFFGVEFAGLRKNHTRNGAAGQNTSSRFFAPFIFLLYINTMLSNGSAHIYAVF